VIFTQPVTSLLADSDAFRAEISGIQIFTMAPEPTSLTLLALGVGSLAARRARRKR
jgi:hypothetical protein